MTNESISVASRIAASQLQPAPTREGGASKHPQRSFAEVLAESLDKATHYQQEADEAIAKTVSGDTTEVAQTMIAIEKATLSFEVAKQVRNQVVQAYEKMKQMPA